MNQSERETQLRDVREWDAQFVGELASLSRLRIWKFAVKAKFEAGVLGELERLRILQFLAFEDSELEAGNMRAFAKLAALRRLDLKGCRFDSEDFAWLCERWANGACPKLNEAWLDGASIGDDELKALGKVERLRWVILSNTKISDAGLAHLQGVKKLETLWLQETDVSEEGVLGLAVLPKLSIVVLGDKKDSERIREELFRAQVELKKSKKPKDKGQVAAADERLRAFLDDMEDWERGAYERAQDIEKRYKAQRPQPNVYSEEESRENTLFWQEINEQKAVVAARHCSQKLLGRGAGSAGSYGNPPQFQREGEWIDCETQSAKKTVFYGRGRENVTGKRRYTLIWEGGEWKVDEVQWWSGGWKRDIV